MIARKKGKLCAFGLVGVALFALMSQGLGCYGVQQDHIRNAFKPEVIAQNAAKIARQCKSPPATAEQEKAAQGAAQLAEAAVDSLRRSMDLVDYYYWERAAATKIRVAAANKVDSLAAQIDSLKRLADMALVESQVDHNIRFMHYLNLPPRYIDVSCATNTLINRTVSTAKSAQAKAQAAYDKAEQDRNATDADRANFSAWRAEVILLSNRLDSLDTVAKRLGLGALDDLAQVAVRTGYKAAEIGYRATALHTEIEVRGLSQVVQEYTDEETEAINRYNKGLAAAEKAETETAQAAYAAYNAALDCGVKTTSIVPRSTQVNAAF